MQKLKLFRFHRESSIKSGQFKIQNYFRVALIVFALILGISASAATIFFGAPSQKIGLGKEFEVGVFLNTEDESINAAEGKIIFPTDSIELKEIREGSSIITLWIEGPHVGEAGQILFAGMTPGGYIGARGYLFSIIFQAKQLGRAEITSSNERVLLNDGQGSEAKLRQAPLVLDIKEESLTPPYLVPQDAVPPEPFEPVITQDPNIFDNQWFLVFATQDKGSGISHYEIQENRKQKIENRKWITAESPYVLKDQKLKSYIYIKAIDKAGNERIAVVEPRYPMKWYEQPLVWVIIVIIGIIVYLIWRKIKKK